MNGKSSIFAIPFCASHERRASRETHPKEGGEEAKEKTGICSSNEWNDVANTQEILLRDSSDKTRPGQTNKRKKLIRMESLILAQDERWRQA